MMKNPRSADHHWLFKGLCQGCLLFGMLLVSPATAKDQESKSDWSALIHPDNSFSYAFLCKEAPVFTSSLSGWGPGWAMVDIVSKSKATNDVLVLSAPFVVNKARGQVIQIQQKVWRSADRDVSLTYDLSAENDVPLTKLVAEIKMDQRFREGDILLRHGDGTEGRISLPVAGPGQQPATTTLNFRPKGAEGFSVTIQPAVVISYHGALRLELAADLFKAGKKSVTLTFHLPEAVRLLSRQSDLDAMAEVVPASDWFPVTAAHDVEPSVIGFEDWLDKPAGKHGGVLMVGDHFEFKDQTPVKFWGVNLAFGMCAPAKKDAGYTAARFAKYGVNAVRLHKFMGSGWQGIGDSMDATKMNPDRLEDLDYFTRELTQKGVYYGFSHTYKFHVLPENRRQLLAYDEIIKATGGDTYGLINWAEDCQDLLITAVSNLLRHKNAYTGKSYAEDPALAYVELQNEDDIFFYTTSGLFDKFPTYRQKATERYAVWLQDKYGDQAGLKKAWGAALKPNETLATKNIAINPNVWEMGEGLQRQSGVFRQRLLDNAAFFHHIQNAFYTKFVKAIRATGYAGPLCGSPWQAASGLPHYYNLKSDFMVGYVDRHNYFGGNLNDTMLGKPGSGDLSTGLQQVAGRPFGVSEWNHVYPSLYSAEGPAIFAVYGMGLQGWSSSYEFRSGILQTSFSDLVGQEPWGVWNADVPTQIGQYPALARMIMRGDVTVGPVIGQRCVSDQNLATGRFGFSESVSQQGDVKSISGNTPPSALAAGRLLLKFSDKDEPSQFPDMSRYDQQNKIISATRQLVWDYSGNGYFTVDTPGTKAVVGFAAGRRLNLSGYAFTVRTPYVSLFLTSLEKAHDLSKTQSALLTAVARNCNRGFKYLVPLDRLLDNGAAPILLEPVRARITCGRNVKSVTVLDQNGKRTDQKLAVTHNGFDVDSAREKTIYYEVVFQ